MATTFTNTATLSYNGGTIQSNTAVGAVEGVLSVSKNTAAQDYRPGDTVTYAVSIVNNSDADVNGLTVSDDLGAYLSGTQTLQPLSYVEGSALYFSGGVLQPAPVPSTATGLVFNDISVPAENNALLLYEAQVNEFASPEPDSVIQNTVTVTGTGVCEISDDQTLPSADEATLALIKSVTPVPVAENGELTYTFRLQNSGNTPVTAEDNAVVSDTFLPILSDIRVTMDGTALTPGTDYTYNETTGVFSTAVGLITIPAATYTQDPDTGAWSTEPGAVNITVTGNIGAFCGTDNVERF